MRGLIPYSSNYSLSFSFRFQKKKKVASEDQMRSIGELTKKLQAKDIQVKINRTSSLMTDHVLYGYSCDCYIEDELFINNNHNDLYSKLNLLMFKRSFMFS